MEYLGHIIIALVGAIGVFFLYTAFTGGLEYLFRKPIELKPGDRAAKENKNPLFVMLTATITDLSRMFSRGSEDLPDRLRRSGYYYPSIEIFYTRRVIFALSYGLPVFIILALVRVGLIPAIAAAIGAAFLGFFEPDRRLGGALKRRIVRISKEMGYSIDLFVIANNVKSDIKESLKAISKFGLFGKFCAEVVAYMDTGDLPMDAIAKVEPDFPKMPRLKEFIDLLQIRASGASIDTALQVQAESLRNELTMEIIRVASNMESRISLMTTLGGAIATVLPILVAMVQIAM